MRVMKLRWWAVLLPTVAILLLDYARHALISGFIHPWPDEAALLVGVLLVVFTTSQLLLQRIEGSQQREREAETLRRIGMEISSTLELESIRTALLFRGHQALGVDCLGMAMADPPHRELVLQTRDSTSPRRVLPGQGAHFLWEVMESGEPRELFQATPGDPTTGCPPCRRCLAIPLKMGSQPLGVLCVGSNAPTPYSPEDRRLAHQMASLASVALANGLLHERAQDLATLQERHRIAREMHDSLAQVLGHLSMKAESARGLLRRGEFASLEAELLEMRQVADDSYGDVREAILGLRVSPRASGELTRVLEEYLERFSRHSGVAARLVVEEGIPFHLPPRTEIQLVRVIQEALTNVRKHARATQAWVRLERYDGQGRITIGDDGQGFDPAWLERQPGGGYGIATMRERLAGIGGRLVVESAPGRGTTIVAMIPLAEGKGADNGKG